MVFQYKGQTAVINEAPMEFVDDLKISHNMDQVIRFYVYFP